MIGANHLGRCYPFYRVLIIYFGNYSGRGGFIFNRVSQQIRVNLASDCMLFQFFSIEAVHLD